jgi:CRP-like cAMP-binding protein
MLPSPRLRSMQDKHRLHLLHGEVVFMPNEVVDAVYLIERGSVVVFSPMGAGTIATLGPHRIIGLRDMLMGGSWQGIGLAQWPTVLRVIETAQIRELIDAAPISHQLLLRELAA